MSGSAATADGDPVGQWLDQSGNGNHVSQPTAGKRPTLKLAIQNGKPVVRFDGLATWLSATMATVDQPFTLFLVAKAASVAATSARFVDAVSVANRALLGLAQTTGVTQAYAGGLQSGATDRSGAWHQWTVLYNGASSLARIDGASEIATSDFSVKGIENIVLGTDSSFGSSAELDGDIGELVLVSGDQTATEMETYLQTEWATP